MFTGLIEEVAVVRYITKTNDSAKIQLQAVEIMRDMKLGDSIAVNGICLTVTDFGTNWFTVDAVPETMRRTNLEKLKPGSRVNVERAMKMNGRFGGHIVSGHIDGVGVLTGWKQDDMAVVLTVASTDDVLRYVVDKGSICINGVSLTVMGVDDMSFTVSIIPHTGISTTLLDCHVGDELNLECDVIAKYVEKLMFNRGAEHTPTRKSGLTVDYLREHGFA